jgi:hypothetical protein
LRSQRRGVERASASSRCALIRIGVPPSADPAAAALLWTAIHDLLRPRFARLLRGQPQIAWETHASDMGTTFGIWVPHSVPPGVIERAVASSCGVERCRPEAGRPRRTVAYKSCHGPGFRNRVDSPAKRLIEKPRRGGAFP